MFFVTLECIFSWIESSGGTYQTSTLQYDSTHFDQTLNQAFSCNLIRLSRKGTKVISVCLKTAIMKVMRPIITVGKRAIAHHTLFSKDLKRV